MSRSVAIQSAIRHPRSAIAARRPFVAEVVGPAGAGKSTVARALGESGAGVRAGVGVWGLPLPLLAAGAAASLPRLAGACARRRLRWHEAGLVVRLRALHKLLGRAEGGEHDAVLLDEGAVFALAKLDAFGRAAGAEPKTGETAGGAGGDGRALSLLAGWASRLDAVVWLDAPDAVLAERLRRRAKPHRMKDKPDAEIYEFLARYRAAYERVVSELTRRQNLRVFRFDTGRESAEGVAGRVLELIRGERVRA